MRGGSALRSRLAGRVQSTVELFFQIIGFPQDDPHLVGGAVEHVPLLLKELNQFRVVGDGAVSAGGRGGNKELSANDGECVPFWAFAQRGQMAPSCLADRVWVHAGYRIGGGGHPLARATRAVRFTVLLSAGRPGPSLGVRALYSGYGIRQLIPTPNPSPTGAFLAQTSPAKRASKASPCQTVNRPVAPTETRD